MILYFAVENEVNQNGKELGAIKWHSLKLSNRILHFFGHISS